MKFDSSKKNIMLKKSFIKLFFILLLIPAVFTACHTTKSQSAAQEIIPTQNMKTTDQAQNEFAFKIFGLLNSPEQAETNKMISPLSLFTALSMVYNGADGDTKKGIEKALQLNTEDISLLNSANQQFMHKLMTADESVTMDIANAIWYDQSLKVQDDFIENTQTYYDAHVSGENFGDPKTVALINNWVKEKTHNKIKSILEQINPGEVMFLLNAVYFKGDWTDSFSENMTRNKSFYTSEGEIKVPFMYKDEHFNYVETEGLQAIELTYGKEKLFSMMVLLPKENLSISEFIASLNPQMFSDLNSNLRSEKVKLFLPKWESSYTADNLKNELSKMGMSQAFTGGADFSNLFERQSTAISSVKHKTYIKVDEEGTEAAAVTSIGMVATSMPMHPPTIMDVNRPFVYLIKERETNTVLFLGVTNNPLVKE